MPEAEKVSEKAIEDRKDVYKFWLGLAEKLLLLLFAAVVIPFIVGQLRIPAMPLLALGMVGVVVISAMIYLSYQISNLPKKDREERNDS